MMTFLLVAIVIVAGGLLVLIMLVCGAIRREDSVTGSLIEPPRDPVSAMTRRILGFHAWGIREWPESQAPSQCGTGLRRHPPLSRSLSGDDQETPDDGGANVPAGFARVDC